MKNALSCDPLRQSCSACHQKVKLLLSYTLKNYCAFVCVGGVGVAWLYLCWGVCGGVCGGVGVWVCVCGGVWGCVIVGVGCNFKLMTTLNQFDIFDLASGQKSSC